MSMTSVRMPDNLMQRLKHLADKLRRSKGWIINDAVRVYLEREERKARMLEDTYEALADVKTGHVIDGDEVLDWLDSWGSESEKAPPE